MKIQKKKIFFFFWGVGLGVRVDVGVGGSGGDVGYGGCKPRIKGIDKCK